MSLVLRLNIEEDLRSCQSMKDIKSIENKYSNAFTNAVDAAEFNKIVTNRKYTIKMRG